MQDKGKLSKQKKFISKENINLMRRKNLVETKKKKVWP